MTSSRFAPLRDIARLDLDVVDVERTAEYPIAGVYGFGRGLIDRGVIQGSETSYSRLQRLHSGQVVLSRLKAFEGAVAVVPPEFDGFFASQEFPTFTIDESRASIHYIAHLCRWPDFWSSLGSGSKGIGARRERLHADEFLELEIQLPPIDEQRRIAQRLDAILSRVEAGFRQVEQAVRKANAVRWATLRAIFDRLSETWGTSRLVDVVELNPESVRPEREFSGGSFVYVDIASVANGSGRITDAKTVFALDTPARARKRIRAGDVLVSTVRPNLRGVGLVPPELDGQVCSTGFAVLRPHSSIDPRFLTFQALSDFFIDQLVGEVRGGHYPAVNDRTLREARIIVPESQAAQITSVADLDRILTTLDGLSTRLSRRSTELGALGLSTLNAAFSQFS